MQYISYFCIASKIRYVQKHSDLISSLHRQLLDSLEQLPLACLPRASRLFWDSPALVANMMSASRGGEIDDADENEFVN